MTKRAATAPDDRFRLPAFCRGCRYSSISTATCDFILIEGHSRGCPVGTGCTKRMVGHRPQDPETLLRRPPSGADKAARAANYRGSAFGRTKAHVRKLALYQAGLSDAAIAKELKISANTISAWRRAEGLPPNAPPENSPAAESAKRAAHMRELYDAGRTDSQIASAAGCSIGAVRCWRHRHGLKSNGPGKQISEEEREQRLRLYSQGLTDTQMAKALGGGPKKYAAWRSREGLLSNPKPAKN